MRNTKRILVALLMSTLLLPTTLADVNVAKSGGAALCDSRSGAPSAFAQTPVRPANFTIVHDPVGHLWINVTSTVLGGPSDVCVVTLSFNGARYGTALGQGQGTAVGNPSTSTCSSVGGGTSCTASIRVDWTMNFVFPDPTVYLWVDYTISVTSVAGGNSASTSASGTEWIWEPSVPSNTPIIGSG